MGHQRKATYPGRRIIGRTAGISASPGPRHRRIAPKDGLDPEFNLRLVNHDDVVTQELAQHFVLHRRVILAADVIAELRLDHAEGRFGVAARVVVLEEFFPPKLVVVVQSAPQGAFLAGALLTLNGTNAVPPSRSTTARLSWDRYALSAGTSLTVKFSAVFSTSGGNCGESPASRPSMVTAVTMFVFTPQMAWAFTQSRPERSAPYFSSNQRTNRDVEARAVRGEHRLNRLERQAAADD